MHLSSECFHRATPAALASPRRRAWAKRAAAAGANAVVGCLLTAAGACAQTSTPSSNPAPVSASGSDLLTGAELSPWTRTTAALSSTANTLYSGWDEGHWRAAISPYAPHLRYSPEHADVWAVAVERQRADNWIAGGSYFINSFGQPSAYLYLGKRFPQLLGYSQLFGQLSGGLLYGYRGKYQSKVPFNHNGYSPGALASLGWQFNRQASLTVHAVGDAAVMFQLAWDWR